MDEASGERVLCRGCCVWHLRETDIGFLAILRRIQMKRIYELQKKIETARHELDEALLKEDEFEYYYEKSTRLDKLIEEYLERKEKIGT